MKSFIFLILLLIVVACSPTTEDKVESVASETLSIDGEPPCDDVEAPKVEVSEEGINLLDEEEGCKLEE